MGYRDDFNGVGVVLYKSIKRAPNVWVLSLFYSLACSFNLEQRNEAF